MKRSAQAFVVAATVALLISFLTTADAQDRSSEFQHIGLIAVRKAVTHVKGFTPDGVAATIYRAWGNAGYFYMVVLNEAHNSFPPTVGITVPVGADGANQRQIVLDPGPGHGVLFAHAEHDGERVTLLIKMTRVADYANWGRRGPVEVQIYNLEVEPDVLDANWLIFYPVSQWTTDEQYCDEGFAFSQIFHLKGPQTDTCRD